VERPQLEVADVFRAHWEEYRTRHQVTSEQAQAARAILDCRTEALGGHCYRCDSCGYEEISYNSCRNRSCPKCQGNKAVEWVEARREELLPVQYFHTVFTLPAVFNDLVRQEPRKMYELLFKAASRTLLQIGRNNLHCQLGFFAILHTWGQTLTLHPHLHCLIPGAGLSESGGVVHFKNRYFVSDKILSAVFRGKFIQLLRRAVAKRAITFWGDDFEVFLNRAVSKDWVVRTKPPFGGPDVVLKYLARYTHRIAIANRRLLSLFDGHVTFRYRDYRDDSRQKQMTLSADEFIRRFLQHVLPKGFTRVRYYGFLSHHHRQHSLTTLRALLSAAGTPCTAAPTEPEPAFNSHTRCCPRCKTGTMMLIGEISPVNLSEGLPLHHNFQHSPAPPPLL